jgi:hypothetical protein
MGYLLSAGESGAEEGIRSSEPKSRMQRRLRRPILSAPEIFAPSRASAARFLSRNPLLLKNLGPVTGDANSKAVSFGRSGVYAIGRKPVADRTCGRVMFIRGKDMVKVIIVAL